MTPRPLISRLAFTQVTRELDRVAPREGILVPLCALVARDSARNPCAAIRLSDLAEVLIGAVVLVPQDRQINQGARVSVRPYTDQLVNTKVEELAREFRAANDEPPRMESHVRPRRPGRRHGPVV